MTSTSYGFGATINATDLEEAVTQTTAALGDVGFGVLTRIDVHTTLKEKLNEDLRPYAIFRCLQSRLSLTRRESRTSCGFAHALQCIAQQSEGGFDVSIMDPDALKPMVEGDEIKGVMDEAKTLLQTAFKQSQIKIADANMIPAFRAPKP